MALEKHTLLADVKLPLDNAADKEAMERRCGLAYVSYAVAVSLESLAAGLFLTGTTDHSPRSQCMGTTDTEAVC
jgi:hypothetical protein